MSGGLFLTLFAVAGLAGFGAGFIGLGGGLLLFPLLLYLPAYLGLEAIDATQLRLGQNDKGIETLKGGITLASKVLGEGYKNYERWDIRGTIRASIRRCAFYLTKGPEEKENILQSTDRLLALIDDEENFQKNAHSQNIRPLYGN